MGVAEVSGTAEAGQSTERDAEHRVGRGLLSRFIGAVFLVLLGGLLVLDQALTGATRGQAALDTQSTALLAESFIRAHDVLLERLADVAGDRSDASDSLAIRAKADRWLASLPSVRRAWIVAADGRRILDIARSTPSPDVPVLLDSLDRARSAVPLSITIRHGAIVRAISGQCHIDARRLDDRYRVTSRLPRPLLAGHTRGACRHQWQGHHHAPHRTWRGLGEVRNTEPWRRSATQWRYLVRDCHPRVDDAHPPCRDVDARRRRRTLSRVWAPARAAARRARRCSLRGARAALQRREAGEPGEERVPRQRL